MYWSFDKVILTSESKLPILRDAKKLIIEIGFGNGDNLINICRKEKDSGCDTAVVGIEMSRQCVHKAARKILQEDIHNCKLILGDAKFFLENSFAQNSADRIIMNFPCPWPKKKHASKRVCSNEFANLLSSVLKIGGVFELNTDVQWYAADTKDFFSAALNFEIIKEETNPVRDFITKYEDKWKSQGLDTYCLEVKLSEINFNNSMKNLQNLQNNLGEADDCNMTMVADNVLSDVEKLLALMEGQKGGSGDNVFVFTEHFMSKQGHGLLGVITVDDGFKQNFYLRIFPCRQCAIGVRTEVGAQPYRTPAVKACIEYLCNKASEYA